MGVSDTNLIQNGPKRPLDGRGGGLGGEGGKAGRFLFFWIVSSKNGWSASQRPLACPRRRTKTMTKSQHIDPAFFL